MLWMMRKYRDFGRLSSTSVIQTSCAMLSESSTKCFRTANISSLRRRSKELVYERASAVLIFEFVPRPNTAKLEGLRPRAVHEILPRPFLDKECSERNWHDSPDPTRDKVFRAFRRTLKQSDGGRQAAPQYLGGSAGSAYTNRADASNRA